MDNLIISVGRQLGSGGCEIAKKLAADLGCKFYDRELINMAAERSGFNPKIFEQQDESHGTLKTLFGAFSGRLGRMFNEFYSNSMAIKKPTAHTAVPAMTANLSTSNIR